MHHLAVVAVLRVTHRVSRQVGGSVQPSDAAKLDLYINDTLYGNNNPRAVLPLSTLFLGMHAAEHGRWAQYTDRTIWNACGRICGRWEQHADRTIWNACSRSFGRWVQCVDSVICRAGMKPGLPFGASLQCVEGSEAAESPSCGPPEVVSQSADALHRYRNICRRYSGVQRWRDLPILFTSLISF